MKKLLVSILALFLLPFVANAAVTFPINGGTGSTTLGGIIAGNGTSPVKSVVIGSNLTFDGTTLSATGGSSSGLATTSPWNALSLVQVVDNGHVTSIATSSLNLTTSAFKSANISQWTNDSGYITGNQTITLSGAVSGSGATSITTSYAGTLGNTLGGTGQNSSAWTGLAGISGGAWYPISTSTAVNLNISGNSGTATALQNARTINSVSFNGTSNIVITAASSSILGDNNTFSGQDVFSNASTTLLTITTGWLPSLGTPAGTFLAADPNGKIIATTTPSGGSGTVTSITGGTGLNGGTITTSGTLSLVSYLATSTGETAGNLAYYTSTNGTPALLGKVATSTLTASSPLTGSFVQIGSSGSLGCQTASGSQAGCLSSTDWTTFNNKGSGTVTSVGAVYPLSSSGGTTPVISSATSSGSSAGVLSAADWTTFNSKQATLTFNAPLAESGTTVSWTGLATTSQPSSSNLLVSNGAAGVYGVATSTLTPSAPLGGSFVQVGSGGSITCSTCLTANQTVTLSGAVTGSGATSITTTYAGTLGNTLGGTGIDSHALTGLAAINGGVWSAISTTSMNASITGLAGTATALATGRTLAITGDLAWTSPSFDGSGNVTAAGTLATVNSNVGSFTNANITVNGKGLITAASSGSAGSQTPWTSAIDGGGYALSDAGLVTGASFTATSTTVASSFQNASTTQVSSSGSAYLHDLTISSIGSLADPLIKVNSAGMVSDYGGATPCTNQFVTAFSSAGATTCASINNGQWSGTQLSIANGGTNATSFTQSGGILAYDGTREVNFSGYTLTSSLLTAGNASTTNLTSVDDRTAAMGSISPVRVGGFKIATSTTWIASSTEPYNWDSPAPFTGTIKTETCYTDAGTLEVEITDGSTHIYFPASSTPATYSISLTITANDKMNALAGAPASSPTWVTCALDGTQN